MVFNLNVLFYRKKTGGIYDLWSMLQSKFKNLLIYASNVLANYYFKPVTSGKLLCIIEYICSQKNFKIPSFNMSLIFVIMPLHLSTQFFKKMFYLC